MESASVLAFVFSTFSVFATLYGVFIIQKRNMETAQKQLKAAQDQLEAARAHYRLSFKPFLVITRSLIPHADPKWFVVSVNLHNNGTGPAIIESLTVYVDGKIVDSQDDQVWNNVLRALNVQLEPDSSIHHIVNKDYCINPKESVVLLTGKILRSEENAKLIKTSLKRSKIVVIYKSFYNERDEYDTSRHQSEFPTVKQLG